ncbi:MAG: hypothetical protein ACKERG_03280 [Candidatus Hodgkinia cicadicola]
MSTSLTMRPPAAAAWGVTGRRFERWAAEGTRGKRCEVLVCAAYLFVLAWGVFEFCDFNFKTGGPRG